MEDSRVRVAFILMVARLLLACSQDDGVNPGPGATANPRAPYAPTCVAGRAGCPCDPAGQTAACGEVSSRSGDYVTCAMGNSVCLNGAWGPCVSKSLVTKSLGSVTLGGAGGLRLLSTTTPCAALPADMVNLCDPYIDDAGLGAPTCTVVTSTGSDVDASSIVHTGDAALTLEASTSLSTASCQGLGCQVAVDCPAGSPTKLTGVVFDPAGTNPVYNATVYVPTSSALPTITTGACSACAANDTIQAVAITKSGPDGSFTLENVPSTDVAPGGAIPLVVQVGNWRREDMLTSPVPKCQVTSVDPTASRLPRNATDGYGGAADMPELAIVTGSNDPMECELLKIGIDPNEFELPNARTGHVDFYRANGLDFSGGAPPGSALYGQGAGGLKPYDLVMLPCEGAPGDLVTYADNLDAFANAGGRVLSTHLSYAWLATPNRNNVAQPTNPITLTPNPFFGVADWDLAAEQYSTSLDTTIDTTSPEGQAFASWLVDVGASTTPDHLSLTAARHDMNAIHPPAEEWVRDTSAPNEPLAMSFDAPFVAGASADGGALDGAAGQGLGAGSASGADGGSMACSAGRVAFSDFHVSTADLASSGPSTCSSDADCGYTSKCVLGAATPGTCTPQPCARSSDCTGGYGCVGAVPGQCVPQTGCTTDTQCASNHCQAGACARSTQGCVEDSDCGAVEACQNATPGQCQMACVSDEDCSAGELCTGRLCQGCWDDTNCDMRACNGAQSTGTCSYTGAIFPLACLQTPMTPQEEALEFLLFDLLSCQTLPSPVSGEVLTYAPQSFTEDFASTCPQGTQVVWRTLAWQASIPATASISFSAQTSNPSTDGGAPDWSTAQTVLLEVATQNTPQNPVPIDVGPDAGPFGTAVPRVSSESYLRLTVVLEPTSTMQEAPTLFSWSVTADCVPSE